LLRVRLTPGEDDMLGLTAVDDTGAPVVTVESVAARPVEESHLGTAVRVGRDGLFELDWVEAPVPSTNGTPRSFALLGDDLELEADRYADMTALAEAVEAGAPVPDVVLASMPASDGDPPAQVVQRALELLQA